VVGEMTVEIRTCQHDELDALVSLLDEEFVFGKGRSLSLRQRFPSVYCQSNLHNIWIALENDAIASALVVRQFDWRAGNELFRGAMIGGVYTLPAHRKKGLSSRLLDTATAHLRLEGVDFAVLWATQHAFYARLGWIVKDSSVLGELITPSEQTDEIAPTETDRQIDTLSIEEIRTQSLSNMILRKRENYSHLPLPAENVEVLFHENEHGVAYALLGGAGKTGFLYEVTGEIKCYGDLWSDICRRQQKLFVNESLNNPFTQWLNQNTAIQWEEKSLAMWLALSERVNVNLLGKWHIPYFDRI